MTNQKLILHQYKAFLNSPLLLAGSTWEGIPLFRPKWKEKPESPPPLPGNLVFGKRIERFFSHYIQCSDKYSLLAENLQVIQQKVTLGELDFLLKDNSTGQVLHVELAYKFYLRVEEEGPTETSKWVGPNRRDRLSRKLQKLKERQFPLLYKSETADALQTLGIEPREVQQQLCLPGYLFIPRAQTGQALPDINNPAAVKGYWIHARDFTEKVLGSGKFYLPEKQDWILHPTHAPEWLSFSQAQGLIKKSIAANKSLMCWMKRKNGELERFFVVWW